MHIGWTLTFIKLLPFANILDINNKLFFLWLVTSIKLNNLKPFSLKSDHVENLTPIHDLWKVHVTFRHFVLYLKNEASYGLCSSLLSKEQFDMQHNVIENSNGPTLRSLGFLRPSCAHSWYPIEPKTIAKPFEAII